MRIDITAPTSQTVLFIILLLLFFFLTAKKCQKLSSLDIEKSTELKGFAILTIIFGHIGYFLSNDTRFLYPLSIASGTGVNLFLFLSGYGLTISALKQELPLLQFYQKRLSKIFLPLWIILTALLIMNLLFLDKSYPLVSIIQSYLGFYPYADIIFSLNSPLWFFTFICFYYLVFPILFWKRYPFISPILIFLASLLFLNSGNSVGINPDVVKLYKLHHLAFPLGVTLAIGTTYIDIKLIKENILKIKSFMNVNTFISDTIYYVLLILLVAAFSYYSIHSGVGESVRKEQYLSLLNMFLIIVIFIFKNYNFRILNLFGKYSFEVYLIHWPILFNYDLLYKNLPPYLATLLYLFIFLVAGLIIQKLISLIHNLRKLILPAE